MRTILGFSIILIVGVLLVLNFFPGILHTPVFQQAPQAQNEQGEDEPVEQATTDIADNADLTVEEIEKTVEAPPPLRETQQTPPQAQATLSVNGVLQATNVQRQQQGVAPLAMNATLNQIAQAKVQDMFTLQYFEHESPTGILFTDLADTYGYEYLAMAENLALGNYASDQALVQAWMDSPGHRANIVNGTYTEIGIAVQKGIYEGQETWLAVQTFALPLAACPAPSAALESAINGNQAQLEELQEVLEQEKQELDAMQPKFGPRYQRAVDEYNELVAEYNQLVEQTKALIAQYNSQVAAFNQCAQSKK